MFYREFGQIMRVIYYSYTDSQRYYRLCSFRKSPKLVRLKIISIFILFYLKNFIVLNMHEIFDIGRLTTINQSINQSTDTFFQYFFLLCHAFGINNGSLTKIKIGFCVSAVCSCQYIVVVLSMNCLMPFRNIRL